MVRLALFFLLLLPSLAAGEPTAYRGENSLYQDTVWEGEILIDGILTVAPEATLEIRPGTVVRFTSVDSNGDGIGEHEIFIQGTLKALGTAESPIVFTSAGPDPVPGAWGAINMMVSNDGNRLEHCTIEYAYRGFHAHFAAAELRHCVFRRNVRGLQFQESTVTLRDCRVLENRNGMQFRDSQVDLTGCLVEGNYWGVRCVYSEVEIRACRFSENLVNGLNLRDSRVLLEGSAVAGNRRGVYLQRSRGDVRVNRILDNSEHGIFLEDSEVEVRGNEVSGNGRSGIRTLGARGLLRENALSGNGEYALINDGAGEVDARHNAWGTLDPEQIAALIRDGRDRPGIGVVDASEPRNLSR